jgi:hypothetical protein
MNLGMSPVAFRHYEAIQQDITAALDTMEVLKL